jgi:hypothetical protein
MLLPATILGKAVPWKLVGIAVAALAFMALVLAFIDRAFDEAEEKGATVERAERAEQTIQNVETANEAREEIDRPDDAGGRVRFCQCLRTARTPANCERLLRGREAYLCGTRPE